MTSALATLGCPKSMEHGPCGGVRLDGLCELGHIACTFLDAPVVAWAGAGRAPVPARTHELLRLAAARPLVVADVPSAALDLDSFRASAAVLAEGADAGLFGDHGQARVQLPLVLRAQAAAAEGLRPWPGLNCRDRNRVALEGELAGLAAVGAAAVHCVTGDHTFTGDRPDAAPVFDLDSTELAALATAAGLLTSVAEAPLSPPLAQRPARLVEKVRAGASICFVNHTGAAPVVADFVAAARDQGAADVTFIACLPVVVSRASAELIGSFTSLVLPPALLAQVLAAPDPRAAGIAAALALAEDMLAVPGVSGVDLSGVAPPHEQLDLARAMADIGARLRP